MHPFSPLTIQELTVVSYMITKKPAESLFYILDKELRSKYPVSYVLSQDSKAFVSLVRN